MAADNSTNSLASSLTDLMTSLMVIFVLLLVASLNNATAQGTNTRNLILEKLQHELDAFSSKGVSVKADPNDPLGLLVLIPEGLLNFGFDKFEIPAQGASFLDGFAPKLANIACSPSFKKEISSIVVEGHTDSIGTDEHNLRLSQDRSMSVVQQTLRVLGQQNTEDRTCFLDFLSANGRGSREPMLDDMGHEDKERSRRVVFKIRIRSVEQREFRSL